MSQEVVSVQFFEPMSPKILEYMIENISIDLQNKNYLSANIRARIVLDLANRAILPKNVIALCFQVQDILQNLGYTEDNFLRQMNKGASKLMLECPKDTIRKELGQDCDAGYEELKGDNDRSFKCCIKIQKELQKMDADNLEILKELNSQDAQLYQEFAARFGLGGSSKTERDGILGHIDDIPAPILKVAQNMVNSENLHTQIRIQTDIENKDFKKAAERVGMSEGLFMYLWKKTGGAIEWFTSHDYSSWFTVVYIFRLITTVLCWIKKIYDTGGSLFWTFVNLILKTLGTPMFTDFKSFAWGLTMTLTQVFLRAITVFATQKILDQNSTLAKLINLPTWFSSKFVNIMSFSLLVGQIVLIAFSVFSGGAAGVAVVAGGGIAASVFSAFTDGFCDNYTVNVFQYVGKTFTDLLSAFMLYFCESNFSQLPFAGYACSYIPSIFQKSQDFSFMQTAIAATTASKAIGVVGTMMVSSV